MANWGAGLPARGTPANYKNRFLSPVTRVFRKRFLTTCLTTDRRGVCGNSGGKSCEERPQQSENGYKAPEKVEKFLFKSLGAGCRRFESCHSDHFSQKNRLKRRFFCVISSIFEVCLTTSQLWSERQNGRCTLGAEERRRPQNP